MSRAGRILAFVLAMLAVVGVLHAVAPIPAHAAGEFQHSNVLADLQSATIGGKPFDITQFPFGENARPQLVSFVEYGYSYRANAREHYGLYVYVYNPSGRDIEVGSKSNKIQMAVAYDIFGAHAKYAKIGLEYCSHVESGSFKNLFYKFKVIDGTIDGTTFADRVNSNQRRYDVSGVELRFQGDANAVEIFVGGTYRFTGFARGCGPDETAPSDLSGTVDYLETLSLDVQHTHFRTNLSSLGENHYNEVNTVYFAVPERIFSTYGNLQKIHAQWWEYKTKMAAVTSNYDFYKQLLQYVGTDVGEYDPNVPVSMYAEYSGTSSPGFVHHHYGWAFNENMQDHSSPLMTVHYSCDRISTIMPYAFYSPEVGIDKVFSFLYSKPPAGSIEASVVQDWIYQYKNDLGNGYIDCNGRQISNDLFEPFADEGRTRGYNDVHVDLSDTFDLKSYDSNHSWWDKLWDFGFSWPATDGDYQNVPPIYEVKDSDLNGSNAAIAGRLLIGAEDVSSFKAYYKAEKARGNRVMLFRFASTDYYSAPAFRSGYEGHIDNTDTYIAQQTVFLDFDIIDLTFQQDGSATVIPAVSDPMDIIHGFEPPAEEYQWWKTVLAVLLLVLLALILLPVLPHILSGVVWLVVTPVKAISRFAEKWQKKRKNSTGRRL